MAEAQLARNEGLIYKTLTVAALTGDVEQLASGRAGVMQKTTAGTVGELIAYKDSGIFNLPKSTGYALLDGGEAWWDRSASVATFRKVNDRDFYLGRVVGDVSSSATTVSIDLNADPRWDIDVHRDAFLSVPTGTQAVGAFGYPKVLGGTHSIELTATNEAQCIDLFSVDRFDKTANAIVEVVLRFPDAGSGAAVDINVGVANATHTTDADSIAESVFFHLDGGALDLKAESDDGTTEVAATDTTVDVTQGSAVANRVHLWIDMRDPADVQLYVDGVNVLPATTFNVNAATGPFGLLAHVEKTSGTTTARVALDELRVRYQEG